jgi:hypothetical protein
MPEGKAFLVEPLAGTVEVELSGRSPTGLLAHPRSQRGISPIKTWALYAT